MSDLKLALDAKGNEINPVELAKRSLLDIQGLLQEGFDDNIYDTERPGVKETIDELVRFIEVNDPNWTLPK